MIAQNKELTELAQKVTTEITEPARSGIGRGRLNLVRETKADAGNLLALPKSSYRGPCH
jgi:hypothetical protein